MQKKEEQRLENERRRKEEDARRKRELEDMAFREKKKKLENAWDFRYF